MMRTKYHGPTDFSGAKITAKGNGRQVSIPYPHELSGEAVHRAAAQKWAEKFSRRLKETPGRYIERTGGYVFGLVCP